MPRLEAQAKEYSQPVEAGKNWEMESFLEPHEEAQPY
jgi:hypothetical protein